MNVCKWQPAYSEEKQYTVLAVNPFDTDQFDGQNMAESSAHCIPPVTTVHVTHFSRMPQNFTFRINNEIEFEVTDI